MGIWRTIPVQMPAFRRFAFLWGMALCIGLASSPLPAQRLLVRSFNLADGLAHSNVKVIHQDSRGHLWIGTGEGVSRFDGYEFTNYGVVHGLTIPLINDIDEDGAGRVWVATNGAGIARFEDRPSRADGAPDAPRPRFSSFRVGPDDQSNQVNAFIIADGMMWCATDNGLYRARVPGADEVPVFERVAPFASAVEAAFRDRQGRIWMGGVTTGVVMMEKGGVVFGVPPGRVRIGALSAWKDRLLVAADHEVFELTPGPDAPTWRRLPLDLAPDQRIWSLLVDNAGTLWVGTSRGLVVFRHGSAVRLPEADGAPSGAVQGLIEDRARTVWIATDSGVVGLASREIEVFDTAGGVPLTRADALTGATSSGLLVRLDTHWLRVSDNGEGLTATPTAAAFDGDLACGPTGPCWGLAADGLHRFPTPAHVGQKSSRILAFPSGVTPMTYSGAIRFRIYVGRDGMVWFGTTEPALYRVRDKNPAPEITRIPLPTGMAPLVADATGTLWVASMNAFGRLRGASVEIQSLPDGLDGRPRSALVDSRGRLWIGLRFGGVVMTEHPEADVPQWIRYTTRNGLTSDTILAMTADASGRVYLVHGRGIDRITPQTGQIRHFARSEMPAGRLDCLTDTQGRIWIASGAGLARLDPDETPASGDSPRVFIRRLEIGHRTLPVGENGVERVEDVTVLPGGERVAVHFGGIALGGRETLRYQYRLDRLDEDWTKPAFDRSVTYGRLAPGTYRFSVRAVDADGNAGDAATVDLTVLPPLWRRWWFAGSIMALVAGIVVVANARRRARHEATEALRRQVATDLHDDVGSGLSQIAIMSEVLQRQAPAAISEGLEEIAGTARRLREVMSDIVWAIGPGTDRMTDLMDRMRHAAFTLIDFGGLRVSFDAPAPDVLDAITMTPDRRRHLLLMFKEAVTNVARHARATQLSIRVEAAPSFLHMTIADDGTGFDVEATPRGQGLNSLQRRAAAIGAVLTVESRPGSGTQVQVRVPL